MGSYDRDVINLLGEDVCDIILYEVDVGKIDEQKMSDIEWKAGSKVERFRRPICDKSATNGGEQSRWRISLSLPGRRGEACGKVKTSQT